VYGLLGLIRIAGHLVDGTGNPVNRLHQAIQPARVTDWDGSSDLGV
jgi:hypothetical protein